jgi:hypothetical protein
MWTPFLLLLPPALALGWCGIRTAQHFQHSKGSRGDRLALLVVAWSPLVLWLLALLITLFERHP